MTNKLKVLIIHLEFPVWRIGKSWSYQAQLGFTEGLYSNNVDALVLINPYGGLPFNKQWGNFAREVIGNRKYDQVWMEIIHSNYDDEFLAFVSELAPVRLAFLCESMKYTEEIYQFAPVLLDRYADVRNKLQYFTHVLTVDEADVNLIETDCGLRALWWVLSFPEWSITDSIGIPEYDKAVFSGQVYGERAKFLQNVELSEYMLHLSPLENSTLYPRCFDLIQKLMTTSLYLCPPLAVNNNQRYVNAIQSIRKKLHKSWINGFKKGVAVVQLPHFISAFPGRIYEGMAAGRPVITMSINNRPRTMQLFKPGKEILFYNSSQELIELIKMVQKDNNLAKQIAENAVQKLRTFYVSDRRVKQILKWVETGDEPKYND